MTRPRPRAAPDRQAPRAEQVRATRHRVLSAARDLFLRRGYPGTTVESVALRAGVSQQTVYNVVGPKAALFKAVYDVSIAGDDEPTAIRHRPAFDRITEAPDARTALAAYAGLGRDMLERVGPLILPLVVEGTGGDADLAAFVATIEDERRAGTAAVARHLAARFGLRPGVSEREAADVLWTLTSPEVADRLIRRCGWSPSRYEAWMARTSADALVG